MMTIPQDDPNRQLKLEALPQALANLASEERSASLLKAAELEVDNQVLVALNNQLNEEIKQLRGQLQELQSREAERGVDDTGNTVPGAAEVAVEDPAATAP